MPLISLGNKQYYLGIFFKVSFSFREEYVMFRTFYKLDNLDKQVIIEILEKRCIELPQIFSILDHQANWFKASQYCRFHGMNLAAIESDRENRVLESHIQDAGE